MDKWNPIFLDDYGFEYAVNPLNVIRRRVIDLNESFDIFIESMRGKGKSSTALSIALLLNPRLLLMDPHEALKSFWSFTTEDRNNLNKKSKRGDVVVQDEQGTSESGSSYEFNKRENKDLADETQLNRTDGVINIGISVDQGRVVKRVRNLYSVVIIPIRKLSNKDTGGRGLYTECLIRFIEEDHNAFNENDRFRRKNFRYADKAQVKTILVPHPPADFWNAYSQKRAEFRELIRSKNIVTRRTKTADVDSLIDELV